MAHLDLGPAIAAIRALPEEFEFSGDNLRHLPSRHMFRFEDEGDVQIHADCNCAMLRASREQARIFHGAFKQWHEAYWRPVEINREFASHFEPPSLWRRLAIRLLTYLVSRPPAAISAKARPVLPLPLAF